MNNMARGALIEAKQGALTDHVIEWAGKPVKSIKKGFKRACERAGLENVTPHTLRHSAACFMAESGVSMDEIAQFMGHSNSRTTYAVYARYSPQYLRKAGNALDLHSAPRHDVDEPRQRNANIDPPGPISDQHKPQ